ncbi:MAG: S1 RNA-binding domain-containing protein [Candidatus Alectryocaccobium sp.]|jgi:small subunit ribosomal protein S1|nr:S1 RNA-binding domain-containing protein [Lachnospiraceae bacterium]
MSDEITTMDDLSDAIDSSFETFRDADAEGWDKCRQYLEDKTILDVTVDGIAVKGGVIAMLEGIRGFIPASHLSLSHVDDLNSYLGKALKVQVLEIDEAERRLILSARTVLRAAADEAKAEKINSIKVGSVLEGTVDSVKPYGAFIKIDDDISGLVHVSQISNKRVADPSKVLKKGDVVNVKVIGIKDGKISLSMKALEEDKEAAEEEEIRNIKFPESEDISSSLGDLLKGFKL